MGFDQQGLIWCVFRPRQRPWSYCVCVCVCVGGGGGAETHFLSQLFKIFNKVGGWGGHPLLLLSEGPGDQESGLVSALTKGQRSKHQLYTTSATGAGE